LAGADAAHVVAAVATGLLGGAVPSLAFKFAIRDLTVAHTGLILNLIPVVGAGALSSPWVNVSAGRRSSVDSSSSAPQLRQLSSLGLPPMICDLR
jgi:hypothetical protein